MTTTSVIIPVRNGGVLLTEVLAAVQSEGPDELIVVDSGSTDGSLQAARDAGATLIEIDPEDFGHGRTRNLAAEASSGEIVCFLTQDATPSPGWLDAYVGAFHDHPEVDVAFGPHMPRPDTSPMIARELREFFDGFSPSGTVQVQAAGEGDWHPEFLSNVNAAYRRNVLLDIGFRDIGYSEDQAFARDLFAAGRRKAFVPAASVQHAHDFSQTEFFRRYFDEYRGLRESVGHVEDANLLDALKTVRRQVSDDARWMRDRNAGLSAQARWLPRSAAHHGGRRLAAVLGSRADRLPSRAITALSLEGRGHATGEVQQSELDTERIPPIRARELFSEVLDLEHHGKAALLPAIPGMSERRRLHVAVVIPPFRTGSGGHDTIFRIFRQIEQMGHTVSIWLSDPLERMNNEWPAVVRKRIREEFVDLMAPAYKGFDDWFGADVVVATSWDTVYPVLRLPGCNARAYFVQDHEPEFFATSAESLWATESYRQGLFAICASPWLAQMMRERYGAPASTFQLGVDPEMYWPRPVERRRDTIAYYGRATTSRRAVPLGVLALAELNRRRNARIVIYGDTQPLKTTFPYEHLGVASQEELARLYSEATVGLCLSVTNYSRAPQEMMACGLPCVDLAGFSAESVFGEDGPVELSEPSPIALADRIEQLMDDPTLWERRSLEGIEFASNHTWEAAALEVERGLRDALAAREETGAQE